MTSCSGSTTSYNMSDYIVPHGGWRTFNQFFARNFKSRFDSTFAGQGESRTDAAITHAFLNPTDYHRQHAPVAGTVLEARVILGQVSIEIVVAASTT